MKKWNVLACLQSEERESSKEIYFIRRDEGMFNGKIGLEGGLYRHNGKACYMLC